MCNITTPIFENTFIFDSYANRKGKGTHAAIKRYQYFAKHNEYVLKCDIKKFFPSIDLEVLKTVFRKKIKCKDTLWLMDLIVDSSHSSQTTNTHDYIGGIEYQDNVIEAIYTDEGRAVPNGTVYRYEYAKVIQESCLVI